MVPVTEGMKVEPLEGKARAARRRRGDLRFRDIETIDDRVPHPGRRPRGAVGGHRTGQGRGRASSWSTTRPPWAASWCCRPTSSSAPSTPATRHARHGHRPAAWSSEVRSYRERAPLDRKHGPGGVLRPQGGRPARGPLLPGPAPGPAGGHRRPGEVPGLQGQHPARRLRRGRLPDPRQPRPGAAHGAALHHRRRQRRPHRRLPRPAGGHPGGGPRARPCPNAAATRCTRTSWCAWACPSTPRHTVVSRQRHGRGGERHHRQAGSPPGRSFPGTEKTFKCDTVLVAVGLDPVDEFLKKAKEFGLPVLAAGDAEEIAEASAAMFTGKIRGLEIARLLGRDVGRGARRVAPHRRDPQGPAGRRHHRGDPRGRGRASSPSSTAPRRSPATPAPRICPKGAIKIEGDDILGLPTFDETRLHRLRAVRGHLPGLAVTLVDYRKRADEGSWSPSPTSSPQTAIKEGDTVTVLDTLGEVLGKVPVVKVRSPKFADHALLVKVRAPADDRQAHRGHPGPGPWVTESMEEHDPAHRRRRDRLPLRARHRRARSASSSARASGT